MNALGTCDATFGISVRLAQRQSKQSNGNLWKPIVYWIVGLFLFIHFLYYYFIFLCALIFIFCYKQRSVNLDRHGCLYWTCFECTETLLILPCWGHHCQQRIKLKWFQSVAPISLLCLLDNKMFNLSNYYVCEWIMSLCPQPNVIRYNKLCVWSPRS